MSRFRTSKIEEKIAYEIFRSCRLCGAGAGYKMPIVQNVDLDGDVPLTQKIRECVQIEVHQEDKMPPLICELCVDKVNDFYEFSEMCKQTNMKTRLRLGLPPQTMPRGAPNAGDCILGVTETIFVNEDSNEPIIKHKEAKQSKSKKETSDKVKIKSSENSRNTKSSRVSPETNRRATRRSIASPTNILTLRNRNSKDQKNVDQPKKKSSEPLKSILKKDKNKEEDILVTPKSKRGRERDSISDLPVKRVKIEVNVTNSKSKRKSGSPPRSRTRSPPRSRTRSPPRSRTRSPPRSRTRSPRLRITSPETNVCTVCKQSFANKSRLENHIKTHQNDIKNSKIKKSPPVAETKSKDRTEKIQVRGKNDEKDSNTCDCGRYYVTSKNLRKHQINCTAKKDIIIDPKLLAKIRPLQIRISRCDPILDKKYSISEISHVFGLDNNCIYPYFNVKTEPKTGKDAMVRIESPIKHVFDDADYIHWDSDTSIDSNYEPIPKKHKVSTLSKLSLKTIFSSRYLGRVRRKRRKVKMEITEKLTDKDTFDMIDSFDDVHDLERINDSSFDQLFDNDYQKISVPNAEDIKDVGNNEGNDNKEENLKEGNNEEDISKEENSDKDVSKENIDKDDSKENIDKDVSKEENIDNEVNKKENIDKDVRKEENIDKEVSTEENIDKEVNKKENIDKEVGKEEISNKDDSKEEKVDKEDSDEVISNNEVSIEEISNKDDSKEENSNKEVSKEENSNKAVSMEENSNKDVTEENIDKEDSESEISNNEVSTEEISNKDDSKEENSNKDVSMVETSNKDVSEEENIDKEVSIEDNSNNAVSMEENGNKEISVSKEDNLDKDELSTEVINSEDSLQKEGNGIDNEDIYLNEETDKDNTEVNINNKENVKNKEDSLNEEVSSTNKNSRFNNEDINSNECESIEELIEKGIDESNIEYKQETNGFSENIINKKQRTEQKDIQDDNSTDAGSSINKEFEINKDNKQNTQIENKSIEIRDLKEIDLKNEDKYNTSNNNNSNQIEDILLSVDKKSINHTNEMNANIEEINKPENYEFNKEIKEKELKDFLRNEELITENDLLGDTNDTLSQDSIEFDERELDSDESLDKNIKENSGNDNKEEINGDVKLRNTSTEVNGDNNDEIVMDDQKLMDELDAQIGEDVMEKHLSLDDFSEDEDF